MTSYHHYEASSAVKHSSVVFLLIQGHPHHQIHAKTGVCLGTISKTNKRLNFKKEEKHGGHPSKLSAYDIQSIIGQITSGKLDNAVQATQFIDNTLTNPISPQTVRNALKKAGLWSATNMKVPMLKQTHQQRELNFAHYHENWTVEDNENHCQTILVYPQSSMEEVAIIWYGAV